MGNNTYEGKVVYIWIFQGSAQPEPILGVGVVVWNILIGVWGYLKERIVNPNAAGYTS